MTPDVHNIDPASFNGLFLDSLKVQGGLQKQAEKTGTFIEDRVRENSFLDEIITPQSISRLQLDRSVNHDLPMKIGYIEPDAEAVSLNFRGAPKEEWIQGPKYEIVFYKVSTKKMKKTEGEIMAYPYPITQVIEKNMVKDMARVKDETFMGYVEDIITYMDGAGGGNSSETVSADLSRDVIAVGLNMLDAYQLNCGTILMSKRDWNIWNTTQSSDVGDSIADEMTRNGYASTTIMGNNVVVTNKRALVAPGSLYFFAPQKAFGENYILSETNFQIKKDADLITMEGWQYCGTGIGNLRGSVKVILPAWTV
jgi:hypothetical protein